MATLTIEIPDELMAQLSPIQDQIPELLRLGLQPTNPATQTYRYVLDFLASQPTPEAIAAFRPTPEMQQRLTTLLRRNADGTITPNEMDELDDYERIEHLIVLLKAGNLSITQPLEF